MKNKNLQSDLLYGLSNFIEGKTKKKQSHKLIINH